MLEKKISRKISWGKLRILNSLNNFLNNFLKNPMILYLNSSLGILKGLLWKLPQDAG